MSQGVTLVNFFEGKPPAEQVKWRNLLALPEESSFIGLGVGRLSADEALAIFSSRQISLERAGTNARGLDATLRNLKLCSPGDEISLHHFESDDERVTLFLNSESSEVIGFLAIPRRLLRSPAILADGTVASALSVPFPASTDESGPKKAND